ncbi:MAG: hypothetical protein ACLT8E_06650 [Akkermansia sp.]
MEKPFAAAGMAVGVIGTGVCLGCLFWLCLSFPDGSRVGHYAEAGAGGGLLGLLPGVLVLAGTVGRLTTVIFRRRPATGAWRIFPLPPSRPSACWTWRSRVVESGVAVCAWESS